MLARHYGGNASTLQGAYWRDINYMRTRPPPPQPSPNPGGGGLASSGGGSGDEGLSSGGVVGVTVAAAGLGLGTLVGLVVWLVWGSGTRRRQQSSGQPVAAPGYSPDTSLCITDVQVSCRALGTSPSRLPMAAPFLLCSLLGAGGVCDAPCRSILNCCAVRYRLLPKAPRCASVLIAVLPVPCRTRRCYGSCWRRASWTWRSACITPPYGGCCHGMAATSATRCATHGAVLTIGTVELHRMCAGLRLGARS